MVKVDSNLVVLRYSILDRHLQKMNDAHFYVPTDYIQGSTVTFTSEETHHLVHVLRMGVGEDVAVVDGRGGWFHVSITSLGRDFAQGIILERRSNVGEPDYDLTIGIALIKQRNRFDMMLEKLVELGVCRIIPLVTKRTERSQFNESRATKILISAMKQSRRSRLVDISPVCRLDQVVLVNEYDEKLICHEKTASDKNLMDVFCPNEHKRRICILIGPEGGFTEEELELVTRNNWIPVSLGPRRLRTETAALSAASAVMLVHHTKKFN